MAKTVARVAAGAALAALLAIGFGGPAAAQDLRISNDGPSVSSSAAGADNVRIERNPGRQQAVGNDGQNNREERRAARREHNRDTNDNQGGNEVAAAPEAAPEQAASGQEAWAPEPQPVADVPAGGSATKPVQLPSTGVGEVGGLLPLAFGAAAALAGALGSRRARRD